MRRRVVRESSVASLLYDGVLVLDGKAWKFNTTEAGVTDYIVVLPALPVWWVEMKRPTTGLEPLQEFNRDWLQNRGQRWACLSTQSEVAAWLAARAQEINNLKWML